MPSLECSFHVWVKWVKTTQEITHGKNWRIKLLFYIGKDNPHKHVCNQVIVHTAMCHQVPLHYYIFRHSKLLTWILTTIVTIYMVIFILFCFGFLSCACYMEEWTKLSSGLWCSFNPRSFTWAQVPTNSWRPL